MKELQVAKEYLKGIEILTLKKYKDLMRKICKTHKHSCQRSLDFLKELLNKSLIKGPEVIDLMHPVIKTNIKSKMTDLINTIKEYDENKI